MAIKVTTGPGYATITHNGNYAARIEKVADGRFAATVRGGKGRAFRTKREAIAWATQFATARSKKLITVKVVSRGGYTEFTLDVVQPSAAGEARHMATRVLVDWLEQNGHIPVEDIGDYKLVVPRYGAFALGLQAYSLKGAR